MLKTVIRWVAVAFVLAFFIGAMGFFGWALPFVLPSHDDTDPPDGRSGLVPYVDAATGCQYLSTGRRYELTPRLRSDGSVWCDPPGQRK